MRRLVDRNASLPVVAFAHKELYCIEKDVNSDPVKRRVIYQDVAERRITYQRDFNSDQVQCPRAVCCNRNPNPLV